MNAAGQSWGETTSTRCAAGGGGTGGTSTSSTSERSGCVPKPERCRATGIVHDPLRALRCRRGRDARQELSNCAQCMNSPADATPRPTRGSASSANVLRGSASRRSFVYAA
eukprot:scaffold21489_cov67-Phaeocystis_antarctica.AAC.6